MAKATNDITLQVGISNRQIVNIALPIAASILVPQANFITNNIFLGGLGEQQLAVAGITGVYYLVFAVSGFGLNNGLQALISRRAGENRIEAIGNLFTQGLRISLAFAAAGILLTYFIAPAILKASLYNKSNVEMAVHFLYIRIWGLPLLYIYQMRNALLVGTNQSRYLIAGTVAETLSNIFFDYALIYGHFGMPAMGFNGAAIASIISEAAGVLVTFGVMHFKGISKKLELFRSFSYDTATVRLILVQSLPLIIQYTLSVLSWEFFYILIEHHGERDLAISNTMRNVFGLFGCISWAFAAASTAMVSNIIGQGLQHRVTELIVRIMKLSLGCACLIFIVLNISPQLLLGIYGQGEDFIAEGVPVVRIVSGALLFMAVGTAWSNAVTGTGSSKINLVIEIFAITVYSVYVYLVLQYFKMSIAWGWMAEWIYWTCLFVPSFIYIRSGKWKHRKI